MGLRGNCDQSGMTLKEIAEYYNLSPNYFYVIKSVSPKKFAYIKQFNPDNLLLAYSEYMKDTMMVKNEIQDALFWLEENASKLHFGVFLQSRKIFTNTTSFSTNIDNVIFSEGGFRNHHTYLKYRKILALFKEYKQSLIDTDNIPLKRVGSNFNTLNKKLKIEKYYRKAKE